MSSVEARLKLFRSNAIVVPCFRASAGSCKVKRMRAFQRENRVLAVFFPVLATGYARTDGRNTQRYAALGRLK
jgi:hypothetical protein